MPLITISQSRGSEGMAIARRVAEHLGMVLYDDDQLQQVALEMGIRYDDLKQLDERAPGLFDRILNRKPDIYLELMEALVYEVARRDQGVIIGHGSQMLLRDFGCAMHVRIHAPLETRIAHLMDRLGISREAAAKLVEKNDQQKKAFMRFAFQLDWDDDTLFDLIINTRKIGAASAARLIMDAAGLEEMTTCSLTALDAMQRLSQEKKVQAVLLENDIDVRLLNIEIPEKGVARISGLAGTVETRRQIVKAAEQADGITRVELDVLVMNAPFY